MLVAHQHQLRRPLRRLSTPIPQKCAPNPSSALRKFAPSPPPLLTSLVNLLLLLLLLRTEAGTSKIRVEQSRVACALT